MNILETLNQNQRSAVERTEGPLLILAGAGSGKTRVITHRIAHLVRDRGISPFRIFAVTFTNKAAGEMRERVESLVGPDGRNIFIRTFHSAAVFILRQHGRHIGIPPSFSIYDDADQQDVVKGILKELGLDPKKVKPSSIVSRISEIKDRAELLEGSDPAQLMPEYFAFDFSEVYRLYNERLAARNALDFNDLLIRTVQLLRGVPAVLEELQNRWKYIMVDEYQDTNHSQYCIASLLAASSRNICVVGDDDQSIYSWRGADIRNILNFESEYPDAMVITLGENYRSTEPILAVAASVISNNANRKEKELLAIRGDGEPVTWCQAANEYGEAEYAVNSILSLKHREGLRNSDFALFYRTNAQSRIFEEILRREQISYRVVGGLKFYDRKEIRDVLAYLRFMVNPNDTTALNRIINTPARGIGAASLDKIAMTARDQGISEWQVIEQELFPGKQPRGLGDFREFILGHRASVTEIPGNKKLSYFLLEIVEHSGYRKALEDDNSAESTSRLENIDEFINSVMEFEARNPGATLDQFIQEISLYTSSENPDMADAGETEQVTLMTVHNAKGLEFPVVFLTGMEERTFPHAFSIDTEEGLEEERRLCYVGITRARDRLFLTSAEMRRSYLGVDYREPSRFLYEIPGSLVEKKWYESEPSFRNRVPVRREPSSPVIPAEGSGRIEREPSPSENGFELREEVLHPKYGRGIISRIEGSGDNRKLTIIFGSTRKVFLEKYTPLQKIR